ncbi:MAG TPA: NAD-binding protein [Chloroflexia bacterium]|nr:NAD-binding protein [Chloroflexia bacterium]
MSQLRSTNHQLKIKLRPAGNLKRKRHLSGSSSILNASSYPNLRDHVILCSLHNLGYRILEQLLDAKIPVLVIDDDPDPRFARLAQRRNVPLLYEDSRFSEVLEQAGIERARVIISVHENDLYNLETVLAANEINPGVRAVASFFNPEIGKQLELSTTNTRSIELTELTAPSFVNATLPSNVLHRFGLDKQELVVVEAKPQKSGTLAQLYGQATALLLRTRPDAKKAAGNQLKKPGEPKASYNRNIVCPAPNIAVESGDKVYLIDTGQVLQGLEGVSLSQADLDGVTTRTGLFGITPARTRRRKRRRISTLGRLTRQVIREMDRPFQFTLAAIAVLVLISVLFFFLLHRDANNLRDLTPLEALYFTITIVTTIGFGDISLLHQQWIVLAYGILLEIIGASILAVLYAFLTNFIVSRRIEQSLGIQRATDMENHIIVTGLDNLGFGYRVVEGLVKRGETLIVMESDEQNRFIPLVRALGVTVIFGDSRLQESLKRINISKASCIVILSNDDVSNLETALAARSLQKDIRVVLRLFDRNLAEKLTQSFGIEIASSTSAIAAPMFVAAALNYEVVTSFYIKRQVFSVVRLVIAANGQINGKNPRWLFQHAGVKVLAHQSAPIKVSSRLEGDFGVSQLEPELHPDQETHFRPGDVIYFAGPYNRIIQVHQLNSRQSQSRNYGELL